MQNSTAMELTGIRVRDAMGQRQFALGIVPRETTVTELVQDIIGKMHLPRNDHSGRPLLWRARLDREGRHLDGREVVGDALQTDDEIELHPTVDAGGGL